MHVLFLIFTLTLFCRSVGDPGKSADLFLQVGEYCKKDAVTYRPTAKGNLEYFYLSGKYNLCIGSKSVQDGKWEPIENEGVSIEQDVCSVDNSCKLDYGKILLILRPSSPQIIAKVKFK